MTPGYSVITNLVVAGAHTLLHLQGASRICVTDTPVGSVEDQVHQQFALWRLSRCLSAPKTIRAREELWLVGGTASLDGLAVGPSNQRVYWRSTWNPRAGRTGDKGTHGIEVCTWLHHEGPFTCTCVYTPFFFSEIQSELCETFLTIWTHCLKQRGCSSLEALQGGQMLCRSDDRSSMTPQSQC